MQASAPAHPRLAGWLTAIAALLVFCFLAPLAGAQTLYWDINAKTAGAGGTSPSGTWNTSNSNKVWSSSSGGTVNPEAWTDGRDAVFSAGTDATGSFTITVSGTRNVSSILIEEGTPTFSGGTINFNDASPDFTVGSGLTATVDSDISGTSGLTKLGAGTLVLGTSDKSYTGTTTISAGTLDLAFNQSFGTVLLAGGTLRLSSASTTITTLNITANSTIDFAGTSTLNLTNFSISGGVTLNIINWAAASDFFYTANWTGASYNTMGSAPMNQITFSGFTASESGWDSWDNQIRPRVPEPSTYGAMLLAALAGFFGWRRFRQARAGR